MTAANRIFRIGLACSLVLTACTETTGCPAVLVTRVVPGDTTIGVGQSFTARYQTRDCNGRWNDQVVHWTTSDSLVIALDTLTGKVTGRSVGDAVITSVVQVSVHVR